MLLVVEYLLLIKGVFNMVIGIGTILAVGGTALGGVLLEKFTGSGGSDGGTRINKGGLIEVGTSKVYSTKKDMSTTTNSYQSTKADNRVWNYSPQIMIDSPMGSQTKKESFSPSTSPSLIPTIIPTQAETIGAGGSGGLGTSAKAGMLIAGAGVVAYMIWGRKKK